MSKQRQSSKPADRWVAGASYEPYVGRWSRLIAREFVAWIAAPRERRWLDLGCGTGALTEAILRHAAPSSVTAADRSPGYVAHARQHNSDARHSWLNADAGYLPIKAAAFDVIASGLVLNFIPDPHKALSEMKRVARPGGTIAAYVWDYAGEMQLMRIFWDAAVALDPTARDLDEGNRFPICRPGPLAGLFRSADLQHVQAREIDVPTVFADFDDYWSPFLGGQGPAPGYCVSLTDNQREELREAVRARLPIRPDGSIHLTARAWAVSGLRPA